MIVLLLLLAGAALADPPPSGVYRLERGESTTRYEHDPKTGKRIRRLPDCKLTEDFPILQTLVIEYASATPRIIVNREDWDVAGLTTDPQGKSVSNPSRIARRPNPPANLIITVEFRATGSDTSTAIMSVAEHGQGTIRCVVAHRFFGSYEPLP